MDVPNFPNDRDYFFDINEDIYQVLGYVHPHDSIYCLKKYRKISKTAESKPEFFWHSKFNDSMYERVITSYSSKNAAANIAENNYCKFSKLYGANFIVFPRNKILHYFLPVKKLNELITRYDVPGECCPRNIISTR
jgi:predicted nucleotidyltransferase